MLVIMGWIMILFFIGIGVTSLRTMADDSNKDKTGEWVPIGIFNLIVGLVGVSFVIFG